MGSANETPNAKLALFGCFSPYTNMGWVIFWMLVSARCFISTPHIASFTSNTALRIEETPQVQDFEDIGYKDGTKNSDIEGVRVGVKPIDDPQNDRCHFKPQCY